MPLATMRTRSSSGRGSASSSVSIVNGPKRSRATAAVICMAAHLLAHILIGEPASTSPGYALFPVRMLQLAVPVLRRIDDHLLVPGLELIESRPLHVLELQHDRTSDRPFAQVVELELADDGLERRLVDVGGELVVVERAGRRDGLLQHPHRGVRD